VSAEADLGDVCVFIATSEQKAVIEARADEGLLVVSGPGSGKTQVAAMRLVHLLQSGLHPSQILVLSFSKSAVTTLTHRIASLRFADEGLMEELRYLVIRTFDSWAFRILRQTGRPVSELLGRSYDENIASVVTLLSDYSDPAISERLSSVRHVIVDEFQDLPGVRAGMVVELLLRLNYDKPEGVGFTVLGDPVQAIYGFASRVSDPAILLSDPWQQLREKMGDRLKELTLTKNHRSTEKLASMGLKMREILLSTKFDPENKLEAMRRLLDGLPSSLESGRIDSEWLSGQPEGSVAILTRTNGEALRVAMMLMGTANERPKVTVRLGLAGSSPIVPAWIAVILSRYKPTQISRSIFEIVYSKIEVLENDDVCRAIHLPSCDAAWMRLIRACAAADNTLSIDLADLRERIEWPDAFPDDQGFENSFVYVTTIHQAKGMEFDHVTLLEGRLHNDPDSNEALIEEANVGYVALTRAGKELKRIPLMGIYSPHQEFKCSSGRSRLFCYNVMTSVQIGLSGDIDPVSFVDSDLHGGEDGVKALQQDLMLKADELRGHKVMLRKLNISDGPKPIFKYGIYLQDNEKSERLLGLTTTQVTLDLLNILWSAGYGLPSPIFNLRIGNIVTLTDCADLGSNVPEPWHSSRFWLGITLVGTGDFKKTRKNKG